MSLNIKNERTVALVRELAAVTGESQTSAIEVAVRERLERVSTTEHHTRKKRNARARAVLKEIHASMTEEDRNAMRTAQKNLYDDMGLPK